MKNHFIHTITSLFPSSLTSCQFYSSPDVAENSNIPLTKTYVNQPIFPNLHKNDSLRKAPHSEVFKNHSQPLDSGIKNSSSSNSTGWFTTGSDKEGEDKFFTISSCSSESFRLKTEKSFSRRFDMKINDLGRCPSALSSKPTDTVPFSRNEETTISCKKNTAEKPHSNRSKSGLKKTETFKAYDFIEPLTELYYNGFPKDGRKNSRGHKNSRRKRHPPAASESRRHLIAAADDDEDGIGESFAVEKSSSDPYGDFKKSMVEMILEKRIFGATDLYSLLERFLSLNSPYYHCIILEVFMEICDSLCCVVVPSLD